MSQEIQDGLSNTDSAVDSTPVESTEVVETNTDTSEAINPAWQGFIDVLPTEYVSQATPILREWDINFQKVQQDNAKYKPYEEFISHNPDDLRAAIQIMQMIDSDPREIFDRLGEHHGYLNAEAGQGDDEEDEVFNEGEEPQFDIESNPLFQQQQEQLNAASSYIQEQESKRMEAEADQVINSQLAAVAKAHGRAMTPAELSALSDIAIGQTQTGAPLDLMKAYESYSAIVSNARNTSANNSAPPVIGGSGNIPVTPKKYDADNFKKTAEALFKAAGLAT